MQTRNSLRVASKPIRSLAMLAAAASAVSVSALAADVTWDNGSTDFLWNTTSVNWSGATWSNAAGNGAVFSGLGAVPITVTEPINVNSLSFLASGYSLNGTSAITFVNGTSTATTGVVAVATGFTIPVNVPLISAVGFQKVGAGTLVLSASGSSFTGGYPLDGRGTTKGDVIIGGINAPVGGGFLQLASAAAMPESARVAIGDGYLDIGSDTVKIAALTFTNVNTNAPWNTTYNANNGVIGSGTLRVTGEINVIGSFGGNFGNSIAANVDLGGGTQIVRVGGGSSFGLNTALMFTGTISNGSLLKTTGYNPNGVQASNDGMGLYGNNTYTGSTILNYGTTFVTGTNATTSIKIAGQAGPPGSSVNLMGANGSALSATLLQATEGGTFIIDNNAAAGTSGGNNQPFVPAAQNNDRIRDDATMELRYGAFIYRGLAATTATETFGNMSVLGGNGTITITPNNVGTAILTGTGNLTMAPRSTLIVATTTTGTGNSGNALGTNAQLKFNGTVPTADATGILPRIVSNTDFLTYNATTGLTPYTGYAADFSTPGTNVSIAASTAVAASVNINALRQTSGSAVALTIDSGQTLGITSGMILNSGFGALTISGPGVLNFGSNPGVLFNSGGVNLNGPVTGSAGIILARGTGTFSGDFSGLTGAVDIYSGTAQINTNTLLSPINNRGGTLNINVSQTAAGMGAITLGVPETASNLGGLLPSISISGAGVGAIIDRDLIVDNGVTNYAGVDLRYSQLPSMSPLSNTTGSQTWSGDITLNTSLRLQGGGAGGSGATTFSGAITGAGTFNVANGRVNFTGTYSNAGGFHLGDQGFSTKVAFLGTPSGNGTVTISGGNSNTLSYNAGSMPSGAIRVWNSSPSTAPQFIPLQDSTLNNSIQLDGDVAVNVGTGITGEWAGPISGDVVTVGAISSIATLTKTVGTGTLVLSGNNTYRGVTNVNAGILEIRSGSALGLTAGNTVVASGAQLALKNAASSEPVSIAGDGIGGTGAIRSLSGNNSLGAVTLTGTTIQVDADTLTTGQISGANTTSLNKTGAGVLKAAGYRVGSLNVNAGTAGIVAGRSTFNTSVLSNLSVTAGATLDLDENDMVVSTTPLATIVTGLQSGYNGGSWNGNGITSTAASNSPTSSRTALGVALASDSFLAGAGTFSGQAVSATDVLVRYTIAGDANLDGTSNSGDFNILATNFGTGSGMYWANGDFTYDAAVNSADFNVLASGFGQTVASNATGPTGAVPEPTGAVALLVLGGLAARRRKQNA